MAAANGVREEVIDEPTTTGRRVKDPELIAMNDVLGAVEELDLHSQYRVLSWAKERVSDLLDTERPAPRTHTDE